MKSLFAIFLIIIGIISLFNYPNLGRDMAETIGAFMGISIFSFIPAYFLIKSDNKPKKH